MCIRDSAGSAPKTVAGSKIMLVQCTTLLAQRARVAPRWVLKGSRPVVGMARVKTREPGDLKGPTGPKSAREAHRE